jgi:hypothetical protein
MSIYTMLACKSQKKIIGAFRRTDRTPAWFSHTNLSRQVKQQSQAKVTGENSPPSAAVHLDMRLSGCPVRAPADAAGERRLNNESNFIVDLL